MCCPCSDLAQRDDDQGSRLPYRGTGALGSVHIDVTVLVSAIEGVVFDCFRLFEGQERLEDRAERDAGAGGR